MRAVCCIRRKEAALAWLLLVVILIVSFYTLQTLTVRAEEDLLSQDGVKELAANLEASQGMAGPGNIVFEVISFIGLARATNRTPVFDVMRMPVQGSHLLLLKAELPHLLDGIHIKNTTDPPFLIVSPPHKCCAYSEQILDTLNDHRNVSLLHVRLLYVQSFKYWTTAMPREEVLERVAPREDVRGFYTRLFPDMDPITKAPFRICVHVRRGDFAGDTPHRQSEEGFSLAATKHVAQHIIDEKKVVPTVVVLGDDPEWSAGVFVGFRLDGNKASSVLPVFVGQRLNGIHPTVKWAFSRDFCDSLIMTASASTFIWWTAYQSRGQLIYYNAQPWRDGVENPGMEPAEYFPSHWRSLREFGKTPCRYNEASGRMQERVFPHERKDEDRHSYTSFV